MTRSIFALGFAGLLISGCAASPYDFPVPVMIDGHQATSMTGYMATADDAVARERLSKKMACPTRTEFVSLETVRADNAVGTPILQYRAIMRCAQPPG
jgi:hypothetical protein